MKSSRQHAPLRRTAANDNAPSDRAVRVFTGCDLPVQAAEIEVCDVLLLRSKTDVANDNEPPPEGIAA